MTSHISITNSDSLFIIPSLAPGMFRAFIPKVLKVCTLLSFDWRGHLLDCFSIDPDSVTPCECDVAVAPALCSAMASNRGWATSAINGIARNHAASPATHFGNKCAPSGHCKLESWL